MPTPQTPIHSGFDGMIASKPEAELRMNLLFINHFNPMSAVARHPIQG
jgi:hypothetical protein